MKVLTNSNFAEQRTMSNHRLELVLKYEMHVSLANFQNIVLRPR